MNTTYFFLLLSIITLSSVSGLSSPKTRHFVGFDLGTSGARISIIKDNNEEVFTEAIPWDPKKGSYDDPDAWMNAIDVLLKAASGKMSLSSVVSICVSGTSASCLIVNTGLPHPGKVTRNPRMYNYDVTLSKPSGLRALEILDSCAPDKHTTRSPTSSLAKLFTWNEESPIKKSEVLCHQADYVAMKLMSDDKQCGAGIKKASTIIASDWQNCLKLGYDVQNLKWPDWLITACTDAGMDPSRVLPQRVVSPGEPIGTVSQDVAKRYGLDEETMVVGGTTDSNAAFFAALGSCTSPAGVGTAVTSLGSTLAMKQWSRTYVEDADRGVYSHRFPTAMANNLKNANDDSESAADKSDTAEEATWLVGGASNVGCAVLRQENFSTEELVELSKKIDPMSDSPLSYYPLVKKGERFPVADSNKEPVLEPVPDERSEFLHAILQGIATVERDGFRILGELGSSPPTVVLTCGGGSQNDMWSQMRERKLNEAYFGSYNAKEPVIRVGKAENTEASFGAAVLAASYFSVGNPISSDA